MRRGFTIRYWLALFATVALTTGYLYHRDLTSQYVDFRARERQVRVLEQDRDALQRQEEELREHLEGLDSDPVEIEAASRSKQSLVREGETIYRVVLESEDAPPADHGVQHCPDT